MSLSDIFMQAFMGVLLSSRLAAISLASKNEAKGAFCCRYRCRDTLPTPPLPLSLSCPNEYLRLDGFWIVALWGRNRRQGTRQSPSPCATWPRFSFQQSKESSAIVIESRTEVYTPFVCAFVTLQSDIVEEGK